MYKSFIILIAAIFLIACGGGDTDSDSSDATGSVTGFVTDSDIGTILDGVTVKVAEKEVNTGNDGSYELTELVVGEKTILASKTGFISHSGKVTISDGQSTSHDIVLTPQISPFITTLKSCSEILNSNESQGDGFYEIDADGDGSLAPFEVYCDMTTEGGGWTLFANHADGIAELIAVEKVTTTKTGVIQKERWQLVRDNMSVGMLFIDEHENVSMLSADKLNSGNCKKIDDTDDLTKLTSPLDKLWHDENSGCNGTQRDYSVIQILGKDYGGYSLAGAALYQMSVVKFDIWPYQDLSFSFNEQNKLLYFIK